MEREEKVRERDGGEEDEAGEEKKEELMGLKLKRSILVGKGKRGGPCTPPPTWNSIGSHSQTLDTATARQLGANLWEILPNMTNTAASSSSSSFHRRHGNHHKNKGLQIQPVLEEDDDDIAECSSHLPDQPGSTGSFHRQIAESLRRHHRSVNRNGRAIQPVSPASFGSSMELTQYNPGSTPSSSLELKGRAGVSNSLKTSTELLKVLNRIWTLEEQHASNVSLVRALKTELDNSRVRIKELLKEKQMDRKVIDDLMRQLVEGKFGRKNTEQERIKSAMQSLREEIEDERKLRKRSETLHHKLARELSDVKSSFSKATCELERERSARVLLEELCDEFALGVRDYEQEMRSAQYKTEKDQACGRGHVDSLVLHMSEAWLDERVQMRLSEELEKEMVAEKLSSEIEYFLRAKEKGMVHHKSNIRRSSLESYHLIEAMSAPKIVDEDGDGDSLDSESNCFELSKAVDDYDVAPKNPGTQKPASQGISRLQSRFQEHMMKTTLSNGKPENPSQSKRFGSGSRIAERLARNNSSSVEGDRIHPEDTLVDGSRGHLVLAGPTLAGPTSPVKKWESKIGLQDPESGGKESTLKARLLEARSEGRQWHAHSKATKG
ncbi:hypothetical protein V2J09_013960 [Rumex salicifolius]